jgi:hypothetical protein
MPPFLFSLAVFEIGFPSVYRQAWTMIIHTSSCNWDDRNVTPHLAFFYWDRVLQTFASNHDPPNFSFPCSWDDRCVPLWPSIGWDGDSWTFCWQWPQTVILWILASQDYRYESPLPGFQFQPVILSMCSANNHFLQVS